MHAATCIEGQPTVILAKTVKGYGMGTAGESLKPTHQQKKMDDDADARLPRPLQHPDSGRQAGRGAVLPPGRDSPEVQVPARSAAPRSVARCRSAAARPESLVVPELSVFERLLKSSGEREISTTMAFVQALNMILRDKAVGPRVVPIVADEARTFGMEGLFRQIGIYAPFGQKYKPVDADQLMYYREDSAGQVLQEGITECRRVLVLDGGGHQLQHQRPADAAVLHLLLDVRLPAHRRQRLAAGDMRARGFLLGATAGRTTLNGEGLQHEDGHSHLLAGAIPNCRAMTRPSPSRSR
jgi:pyruvate dehydrogenase E1 component